jgi:DNA-binding beta-propeller fold protein YncE
MIHATKFTAAIMAGLFASAAMADGPLYTLDNATTIASTDTDWDYIKLQPGSARLFIARRKDGLTVFDINTRAVIATLPNSIGANGPLLVPQHNRGYAAMTDGSLLSFDLSTLAVIDRVKLDEGGLNTASYDPATRRVQVIVGSRKEPASNWYTLDAATGRLLGKKTFPFRKMDEPGIDGRGNLYAPVRYDRLMLKLDSQTLEEKARWQVNCEMVVAVEYQHHTDRLLVACRGVKPVFLVLDPADGREIARLPIGQNVDGLVVDEARHRIVTSNGNDSSLTVIRQDGPDSYTLLGNIQTRPQARVMQIDEHTGRLFTVTATATFPAPSADGKAAEPIFHPNSFTVLTYKPE